MHTYSIVLYTFETRLTVDPELDALLASNSAHWSWGLRKAWSLLYRQGLSKPQAYAELCKLGFTSHQVGSVLKSAEMKHSALVELKKLEVRQLQLAIHQREDALREKQRKVAALKKRQVKLRAKREHLMLYSVNPLYSSVGGFAKYGRANRMNADTSAALWIGRQALYGELGKTELTRAAVKPIDERLVFSHLPATPMQSMTALAGAQWRDIAWGLGANRALWGLKLRRWFDLQVEVASRSKEQPALALSPAG